MIVVALYHVVHNVCACRCFLGNSLLIGPILLQRIHHCTAGGATRSHQLLLRPIIGQDLGLRRCVPRRTGFLDSELHLCFCERVVAARLCGDSYGCVANILIVGDFHIVIAGCQYRTVGSVYAYDRNCGVLIFAIVGVGVSGGRDGIIRLQIVAGQRDRHVDSPGVDRPLGSIGIADGIFGGVASHSCASAVQRDRLAGPGVGVLVGSRQSADRDAVGSLHQVAGLHRRCDCGIVNSCGPIVVPPRDGHLRRDRLGLHGKGPGVGGRRVVGDRPRRLDRDGPDVLDGKMAYSRINFSIGAARFDAPGHRSVSSAAGSLQRGDGVAVIDVLGLADDF